MHPKVTRRKKEPLKFHLTEFSLKIIADELHGKNKYFIIKPLKRKHKQEEKKIMSLPIHSADEETHAEADRNMKIQALRDMVMQAEKTIQGAKAMLLQIEGKKKSGRPKKIAEHSEDGQVVEGTFDGQIMIGTDGKQYPVPANYASKSKLVEGDMLKLTITDHGTFLYKQIGPIERRHAIGIVTQDEGGNYYVLAAGKPYRVLLASITYFKASPGDEVAAVLPAGIDSTWAAIENITQKGSHQNWQEEFSHVLEENSALQSWKKDLKLPEKKEEVATTFTPMAQPVKKDTEASPLDGWIRDMEEIEKEIKESR